MRDAGSARQKVGHSAFAFWFWVVGDHPSALMSHQSVTSVKAVVARGAVAACNGAATRSGRPRHTDTPRTMGGYRARSGIARQTTRRTDGGGNQNPTHTGAAQTPYTSALARCGRRSPLGPISPFQRRRAATRRAEPVSAGDLGAARDAGMRDGSVGSVPKADRLGCELRQPPFLYPLDHVQAVGGRAGWPRAGGGEGVRR